MSDHAAEGASRGLRPRMGSIALCLLTTLYLLLAANWTFWTRSYGYLGSDLLVYAAFVIGISALMMALLTTFSVKYLTKPVLIFFVLVSSSSSWFNDQFGVIIDKDMIRNAAVSTPAESAHLITVPFVTHILLTGVLPSLLILWVRLVHRPFLQKFVRNMAVILPCVAVFVIAGLGFYRNYASVGREHGDLVMTLNPVIPIVSSIRYALEARRDRHVVAQPLGTDAHQGGPSRTGKPRVTIIVAGETARAQDFSLGGYDRGTNPELAKQDVVYFPNATSCGTATAVSIPCMFSVYTRQTYTHRKGMETENLLDVLRHARVGVTWWDNDTGSYGVTARADYTFLPAAADPRFCRDGECLDTVLLDRLDAWLDNVRGDSVLVLHQLGSHGPAYYQRYPEEFRRFTPDCRSADFGKCKPEEIVNAYDNTILFTDHVVASVIDRLKQHADKISAAMIYLSDHGESLGESGLYLHGAPYIIAPSQQTHIPMLVWLAGDFASDAGVDMACMKADAGAARSHDNLFHSLLGLMDVETGVYDPSLDLFAACRKKPDKVASSR